MWRRLAEWCVPDRALRWGHLTTLDRWRPPTTAELHAGAMLAEHFDTSAPLGDERTFYVDQHPALPSKGDLVPLLDERTSDPIAYGIVTDRTETGFTATFMPPADDGTG